MSGVVALLGHGGMPVDSNLLWRMTARQRFRGPDNQAIWAEGSIGLGHTLHKTTVESECEISPCNLDGRLFVTADARIDARADLCARLRDYGRELRTDLPDPELLLHAYDTWGEGCFEHLLGDFSFALWDAARRKLVCAVDHLGVKPFFYANRGGFFIGSNTLECVRLLPAVRNDLNEVAVGDFLLVGGYQDRDVTIYADIARIPPGHFLVVNHEGRIRIQRYFSFPEPSEAACPRLDDCVEQFEELLSNAVADRLRAPRIAVYMSGGVDSSLVALAAKRELSRHFAASELQAFTVVYDRLIPDDERIFATLVAEHLNIGIDVQPLDEGGILDAIRTAEWPEPYVPIVAAPLRAQRVRMASRFRTMLTGFDGDSLLDAAVRLHWPDRLRQGRLAALIRELAWYVASERAVPPIGVRTYLQRAMSSPAPLLRPPWLQTGFWQRAGLEQRWQRERADPPLTRSRQTMREAFSSIAWGPLFDSFDAAYSVGPIDVRHPLLDIRLIRFASRLAAVPWCVDKYLLRRCLRGLPERVRTRPKRPLAAGLYEALLRNGRRELSGAAWQSDLLPCFLDIAAAEARLLHVQPTDQDFHPLLRALAFGVWMGSPGRSITVRERADV
jgi:asparagine synthase (glutamine-hydrolysing)